MRIILTGQALLQSDSQIHWPETANAMRPLLDGDVVFTNFETMVVRPGDSLADLPPDDTGHMGPPEMLDALQEMGFNLLAMSNNHSYDLRERGIRNLLSECDRRGLANAGVGLNSAQASAPAYLDTAGGRVALISMATGLIREGGTALEHHPGINVLALEGGTTGSNAGSPVRADADRILESIRAAKEEANIVIAYHHNHAYDKDFVDLIQNRLPDRLVPPEWVKQWAYEQIDAGADIVVGHGLPLVQGLELYQGRPIFYNLGNFMFQLNTFFWDLFEPDVLKSVVTEVELEAKALKAIRFRPIVLDDTICKFGFLAGMPKPASSMEGEDILQRLACQSQFMGSTLRIASNTAELVVCHALASGDVVAPSL